MEFSIGTTPIFTSFFSTELRTSTIESYETRPLPIKYAASSVKEPEGPKKPILPLKL
jgi:hypothetical protein